MKAIMKSTPDGLVAIAKAERGEDLRQYFSSGRQQGKTELAKLAKKLLGEIKKNDERRIGEDEAKD